MVAVIELGQRRLHGAVATIDCQHLRPDARDQNHRLANLARVLDLIMEDIGVVGTIFTDARQLRDIAGRFGVRQKRNPDPRLHRGASRR